MLRNRDRAVTAGHGFVPGPNRGRRDHGEPDLHAKFFQSCVRTGGALQLRDARRHPLLGALCQSDGIGSLIIVPIFHNRKVVGATEFLYNETRSFSTGQVMDLELIAGVVSRVLSEAGDDELKPEGKRDSTAKTQTDDDSKPTISDIPEPGLPGALAHRLTAEPTRLGRALKRVWTQMAHASPLVEENVTPISVQPKSSEIKTEAAGTEPMQPEAESTAPSAEPMPDAPGKPRD